MQLLATSLGAVLYQEVAELYEYGFPARADSHELPAISELAEAVFDATESAESVEALLRHSVATIAPTLQRHFRRRSVSRGKLVHGLEELLGLTDDLDQKLEARRERAGSSFGYPNGNDGLRKATRKVNGSEVKLDQILREALVTELVTVAADHGFNYTGRYMLPKLNPRARTDDQTFLPTYLALIASLNVGDADEQVKSMVEHVQEEVWPTQWNPLVGPIVESLWTARPELSHGAVRVLGIISANLFGEMLDIYETSFNSDAEYSYIRLIAASGDEVDRPPAWSHSWWKAVSYLPQEKDHLGREEWLLLWIIHRWKKPYHWTVGVIYLLGLDARFRGVPRAIREEHASQLMGYADGNALRASAIPLRILYDVADALTNLAAELKLYSAYLSGPASH